MLHKVLITLLLVVSFALPIPAQFSELFRTHGPAVDTSVPGIQDEQLRAEFLMLFGPRPQRRDFSDHVQYLVARSIYDQKAKYFGGIAEAPERVTAAMVARAMETFRFFGVPEPIFYKDRYGINALFRGPVVLDTFGRSAVLYPEHVATNYQIKMIRAGHCVEPIHFFMPASLRQANKEACK